MRRLMAVPLSAGMLMFVVGTSVAQSVTTSNTGSLNTGGAAAKSPTSVTSPAKGTAESGAQPTASGSPGAPGVGTTTPAASTAPTAAPVEAPVAAPPMAAATSGVPASAVAANTAVSKDDAVDAGTYGVRLRDLEQRINELKEQIFRSKARLSLLAETVLQGVVAGSQAHIVHENKMGNSYKLVKVVYALDGAPIFNKADEEGSLGDQPVLDIYDGSMVPGEHTLTVKLEYRGFGYGIFSYLKGYRFKVSSSHTFTAPEAKALSLRVVGYEKGGPTAPLEERPAVSYVERVTSVQAGGAQAGAGAE